MMFLPWCCGRCTTFFHSAPSSSPTRVATSAPRPCARRRLVRRSLRKGGQGDSREPVGFSRWSCCCPALGAAEESTHLYLIQPNTKCQSFIQSHPLHISRSGFFDWHISRLVFAHAMLIASQESGADCDMFGAHQNV